ncbi:alcohol dehydrogenase [Mycena sanguinolenta]|uniref:Alcohol dehydrogenase n=1 Tax=Mycena sanguinolenta TaxID=230812 RepID=A0A8H6Y2D1_9AGAR|nr:alcohol dehydrogenase [Mycena sanguinolenta]
MAHTIPATMIAAVYKPGYVDLVLEKDYPIRKIEDDEILLKVSACGVCHSDVFFLSGVGLDTRTYVLGHEISGKPVQLGSKVDKKIQIGKLYSVFLTVSIPADTTIGTGADGGYAQYVIVKPENLVEVPENVSPEAAAAASDAGTTAYNAVKHTAGVTKGMKVLIFGAGGLGHLAVQFAKHLGATVYVCDFKPAARQLALSLGADDAFDLIDMTNKTAAGFTVDCTIDFVANNQTFNLAMAALKGNAVKWPLTQRLVMVGVSADTLSFSTSSTVYTGVQIFTNVYGPENALEEVLDLISKGIIRPHIETVPLAQIQKAIDDLRGREYTSFISANKYMS